MRGPSGDYRRPYRGNSRLRSSLAPVTLTPMCLGKIELLAEVWEDGGTRVARSECGAVLSLTFEGHHNQVYSLAFTPEAVVGSHVVAHAGVAVRVLDPESAEDAEALREAMAG